MSKKSILDIKCTNVYVYLLDKAEKSETKNSLIGEKNYRDLVIYFTKYVHNNAIEMLSLHYHDLMRMIAELEGKKYWMIDDHMLDKALVNFKERIGTEKFDDTKTY